MPGSARAFLGDKQRWIFFALTAGLGLFLDLASKEWAFEHPSLKGPDAKIELIPGWFDLALSVNKGAAFGMLMGAHSFFLMISALAFIAIVYFVHVSPRSARLGPALLGLILAGVAGNFWDRCVFTHVRDFLYAHTPPAGTAFNLAMRIFGRSEWPNFNFADAYICVGAIAIVIGLWREERKNVVETPAATGPGPAAQQGAPP